MGGIFGIALRGDCSEKLFYGTDYHSHLADKYGGLAVADKDIVGKIHDIRQGQFKSRFADDYLKLKGHKGIGVISNEPQPIKVFSDLGEFAICTNGFIGNSKELVYDLLSKKVSFSDIRDGSVNQTELVGKLICEEGTFVDGINNMFRRIQGSMSLLVLTKEGIYAASDVFPLAIGKSRDGYAVASETSTFPNLEFEIENYLGSREVVFLNEGASISKGSAFESGPVCSFLWIYTGFPASNFKGVNVEKVREFGGRLLAKRDTIEGDLVAGVPDSGTAYAAGYSEESGIPFKRPLLKYTPGWGRSYIPPQQGDRDLIAHYKIIPVPEMIEGQRIFITEDSIVRGTQLKNLLKKKVWKYNPKEIHVRVACPPLMSPCGCNSSTRTRDELIAWKKICEIEGREDIKDIILYLDEDSKKYKKLVEAIGQEIGATTLRFQRLEDMVESIGLPKGGLCLDCWKQGSGDS